MHVHIKIIFFDYFWVVTTIQLQLRLKGELGRLLGVVLWLFVFILFPRYLLLNGVSHCSEIVWSNRRPFSCNRYESEKLLYHYIKSVDKLQKKNSFHYVLVQVRQTSTGEKQNTFLCHMHIIQIISKTKTKWSIYIQRPSSHFCTNLLSIYLCTVLISQALAHEAIMNTYCYFVYIIMCDNVIT